MRGSQRFNEAMVAHASRDELLAALVCAVRALQEYDVWLHGGERVLTVNPADALPKIAEMLSTPSLSLGKIAS